MSDELTPDEREWTVWACPKCGEYYECGGEGANHEHRRATEEGTNHYELWVEVEEAFRWLCEHDSAEELGVLLEVGSGEILLWHREGLPDLPGLTEERILKRRRYLAEAQAARKAARRG